MTTALITALIHAPAASTETDPSTLQVGNDAEEGNSTETETTGEASTETTTGGEAAPAKPKRVRSKKAKTAEGGESKPKAKSAKAPKEKKEKRVTKADLARKVFARFSRGKTLDRAKILEALEKEAGLTPKGAATYYQSLKNKRSAAKGETAKAAA